MRQKMLIGSLIGEVWKGFSEEKGGMACKNKSPMR